MTHPALSRLVATACHLALPAALFVLVWTGIDYFRDRALEMEQTHTWSRFQQLAAQEIAHLRREFQAPAIRAGGEDGRREIVHLLADRSDALDIGLEVIEIANGRPTPLYQDPGLRPAPMVYAEAIDAGERSWLVEASPLPGHYSLEPSPSVQALQVGAPLLGLLAAALAFVLQSRNRAIRRQVARQTAALEQANRELARSNAAMGAEVDQRMRSEAALRKNGALQSAILDCSEYAIISTDAKGLIQLFNPAAERIFGWPAAEVIGHLTLQTFYPEDDMARLESRYDTKGFPSLVAESRGSRIVEPHELTLQRRDGSRFPASLSISPLQADGHLLGYLGIVADVSHRKAAELRIRFLAHYDALTELPNRSLLNLRLTEALDTCRRRGERLALLFLDLDRFKYVNDSLGHHAGDLLLQAVSQRFMTCVRGEDTVARMGGDEFVILLPALESRNEAAEVAERVLQALRRPFDVRGQQLTITPSIGIALYPDDGPDEETLIKHADAAMYSAKEEGRNGFRFYTRQLSSHVSERLVIENQLRQALERQAFVLHYQPQVDVASGEIVGMEALLRWNSPERGLVPPDRFIPIAEDSGLIVPIGEWVLRAACAQAQAWREAGLLEAPVAVNLSARQFDQSKLPELVAQVLEETGLPARLLELELTESLVMRDPERSSDILNRCKALGLQIAVDDFGTGYSSLAYLRRFPIDRLKIDRSFIKDIVEEPDDAAIARTVVAMAHSLRLAVVAEGVESVAQLRLLREWQCDIYQGFLSSRPLPGEEISALLAGLRAAHLVGLPLPVEPV